MIEHLYLVHYDAEDAYLAHHGILGQKWGVRRWQNKDGTLTEEGKQRYNKLMEKANNAKNEKAADSIRKKASKYGTETAEEREKRQKAQEEEQREWNKKNAEYYKSNAKDIFTAHDIAKDKKRAKEAADLGLKALNKAGGRGYDEASGITNNDREWFVWEDQTIGYFPIADMALRGKTKEEVKSLIEATDGMDYDSLIKLKGAWELNEFHYSYDGDDYIDAVYEVLDEEKANRKRTDDNHTNVESIYTKRNANIGKDYVKNEVERGLDREVEAITKKAVDDYVEVANGRMSMEDFNEKYRGTGFRMYQ